MIKLSDYIFNFIKNKQIKHIFMLPGGGAMHLVDSLGKSGINYICCAHEQAVSIAAESYAQHTNNIGVALVTSGPGSTNAITGVTAAWIDSTPMLIISGQAKRSDLIGNTGVRQMGSQEVEIIKMVRNVTKYAVQILEPNDIKYHLENAYNKATSGRMGPVWLDIPLDVQSAMIDEYNLREYRDYDNFEIKSISEEKINKVIELINSAEKPLFLAGNGIKLSGAEKDFYILLNKSNIPVVTTWKAIDLVEEEHPLYVGHPGIMGDRGANLILQNCDLLIVLGSRLDSSITAFNHENFGKNSKKVIVDIDENEINKLKFEIEVEIVSDLKLFFQEVNRDIKTVNKYNSWISYCKQLRTKYPVVTNKHRVNTKFVSAYFFIEQLSDFLSKDDVIVPESSGGAGEITYQAFKLKQGQKMKNAAGLGSMGFGLPYAIGACLANERKRTILINGDGAFQLNIQELETVKRLNLPLKIFIWSNQGYASIRAMQNNNFNNFLVGSDASCGFTIPEICKVAQAYDIKTISIMNNNELEEKIEEIMNFDGPILCNLIMDPNETVSPRVKTFINEDGLPVSGSLEQMWPFID